MSLTRKLLLKNRLIVFIVFVLLFTSSSFVAKEAIAGICKETLGLVEIMEKLCYECVFPFKLGTIPIIPSNLYPEPVPPAGADSPVCICQMPPPIFLRIGLVFSFWEPLRLGEVVLDPWCFPSLGFKMEGMTPGMLIGKSADVDTDHTKEPKASFQVHWYVFPFWSLFEIAVNEACFETAGVDLAYMSEVDYSHQDETVLAFLFPESSLFGNPLMLLACIPDAISAGFVGWPLDWFFWCMGTWGGAYPPGGMTTSANMVGDASAVLAKFLLRQHRSELVFQTYSVQGACGQFPAPIWRKSWWRFQLVLPVAYHKYTPIGYVPLIWTPGKNIPFSPKADNFSFVVWKLRYCCGW